MMLKRGDMLGSTFMVKVLLPMFSKTATQKALQKAATKTG